MSCTCVVWFLLECPLFLLCSDSMRAISRRMDAASVAIGLLRRSVRMGSSAWARAAGVIFDDPTAD